MYEEFPCTAAACIFIYYNMQYQYNNSKQEATSFWLLFSSILIKTVIAYNVEVMMHG